jgi:poly-gamma-glutamate biosynthesis protein PgsC/CapC
MIIEALFIGLVVGFLYYEMTGISPGGVIAPGYLALFVLEPTKILMTLLIAVAVWGIILFLSGRLVLYGRRKLLLALLIGFALKMVVDRLIQPLPWVGIDLQSIGYIIPGLIGNEMVRQRAVPTLASLAIVTVAVYFILRLLFI